MSLVKCPECSKEISDTAKSCPSCGKSLKKSSAGKVIGIFIGVIAFVLIVLFLISARNAAQASNTAYDQLTAALGYYPSELVSQAKELSSKLYIPETDIIKGEVVLAGYTKNEQSIKKLMPSVLDVAAAKKMSIATAADEVGKLLTK
jgi:hypothetical protein